MKLDWPHVALFLIATLLLAGLIYFATSTGNASLLGIGVTATGVLVTSLLAALRGSSAQAQVSALKAAAPTEKP